MAFVPPYMAFEHILDIAKEHDWLIHDAPDDFPPFEEVSPSALIQHNLFAFLTKELQKWAKENTK